jgi:hypothetical protein
MCRYRIISLGKWQYLSVGNYGIMSVMRLIYFMEPTTC